MTSQFEETYITSHDGVDFDGLMVTYYEVILKKQIGKYSAGDFVEMIEVDYNRWTITLGDYSESNVYTVAFSLEIESPIVEEEI